MDPLASIGGLATGVDFRTLADQIAQIESGRLDYLRTQITRSQAKQTAWGEARGLLDTLRTATSALGDGSGLDVFTTSLLGANTSILSATASASASPGRHTVRVLQAAQREVLASDPFASRTVALGLSGTFSVGGKLVTVDPGDSLQGIAGRIEALDAGVDASVVGSSGAYKLVVSSSATGSAGTGLIDLSGVLGSLGFTDGVVAIKSRTSGGFRSDGFQSATTTVGALLGFSGSAPSGTVTLGAGANAFTVTLDLGALSLTGVRDAINAAAASAGAATFAEIVTDTTGGSTTYRLQVTGEAAATDDGAVLQALGVLAAGRGAVSQTLAGAALATDALGTPATAATTLTSLFNGASNAQVTAGDTIAFSGTRHDGTTFSFVHTIQAGDTVQTLLTRLEGAEGFDGSAVAAVDASGRITITSSTSGASSLALQAWAGNESGAILDLGAFDVVAAGRDRLLSAGVDAMVEIDGALVTSASNDLTDVVTGVTLQVLGADPGNTIEVVVDRDVAAGVEAIRAFVDAYNALVSFVGRGVGTVGAARPPLAGDSLLRGMRDRIASVLQGSAPLGTGGSIARLSDLGLEISRAGTYELDEAVLQNALRSDTAGALRLFRGFGVGTTSSLTYIAAGPSTQPGTYDVAVSQLGSRAVVETIGFGGTYVDDATGDTLSITDLATNAAYQVTLANGMTLAEIVAAINAELAATRSHEVTSERTLYADSGASTVATGSTPLGSLYHGAGQSSGFVSGTEITISGTRPDGSSVLTTFDVTDPSTQTLGQLRAAVQAAFGSGVSVTIGNGQLVARDLGSGQSPLALSVGSDVAGNVLPFGQMLVTVAGRDAAGIVADAAGTELRLSATSAGAAQGFSVAFAAGGSNGTASLALPAGSYAGSDVVGTIGGEAATGVGDVLTADPGTTAAGLAIRVSGSAVGALGSMTYTTGFMATIESYLDELLRTGDGAVDGIVRRLDEAADRIEERLLDREARVEVRRQALLARFAALEEAMSRAQSIQQWLTAQLGSLPGRDA